MTELIVPFFQSFHSGVFGKESNFGLYISSANRKWPSRQFNWPLQYYCSRVGYYHKTVDCERLWTSSAVHLFPVLFPAISWGDSPRIPNPPPQKNTQNTKNIKKCIKFTPPPRYVFSPPRTWSLELTLTSFQGRHLRGAGGRHPPSRKKKKRKKEEEKKKEKKEKKEKKRKKGTMNNVKLLHIKGKGLFFSNFSIVRWHWKKNCPPKKKLKWRPCLFHWAGYSVL